MVNETTDVTPNKEPLTIVDHEIINTVDNIEIVPNTTDIANINESEAECVVMDDVSKEVPTANDIVVDNISVVIADEICTKRCDADAEIVDINKSPASDNNFVEETLKAITEIEDVSIVIGKTVNTSLGLLAQYTSSEDDDSGQDTDDERQVESNATKQLLDKVFQQTGYRDVSSDDDTDTDTDSDIECIGVEQPEVIQINDEIEDEDYASLYADLQSGPMAYGDGEKPSGPIKAKGEFGLKDLPPIEDLTITVSEDECIKLGTILRTVDTLVLIESLPNFAAVDLDTVLFLNKGNRTLGQVFDIMGIVTSPIYCVRFNKFEDIVAKDINIGDDVYVAPRTEHTSFIVLTDLMKQKGCDASWEDDIEPPSDMVEYSDDEEEMKARRDARHQKRPHQQNAQRNRTTSETSGISSSSGQTTQQTWPRGGNQNGNKQRRLQNRPYVGTANQRGDNNRFYKDNKNYAETGINQSFNYHPTQSFQYDHSWHTAGSQGPRANIYPNPFAHQIQQMPSTSYGNGLFNRHFPPLLPPGMIDNNRQQQQQQQQRPRQNFPKNRQNWGGNQSNRPN